MRIGTRLSLAVLPSAIGFLTLAGLAYWGEYGRQAPESVVIIAAVATIVSSAVAWRNHRYIVARIDAFASEAASVQRLAAERSAPVAASSVPTTGSAAMLRATAADLAMQLDEIRLPLQILLDNHFGDLNDNQEEMLGAARAAADRADESLRRAITVLTAQDGTLEVRHDRLHVGELIEGMLSPLRVLAAARKVTFVETIGAPFPAMQGDRVQLQLALRTLGVAAMSQAREGGSAAFTAAAERGWVTLDLAYDGLALAGMPLLFGASLVAAHGGAVEAVPGRVVVRVPVAGAF